jgi:hypothetical protein
MTVLTQGMMWTVFALALGGAMIGTLLAHIIRERVLARPLHRLRTQRTLEMALNRYRDSIVLAALELCSRLMQICRDYPPEYLDSSVLETPPQPSPSAEGEDKDLWLHRYTLESSVYRLCALLGWFELYRQAVAFVDTHATTQSRELESMMFLIRADMADMARNISTDAEGWYDVRLLREEQRAIGEAMIHEVEGQRTVLGYGEFCRLLAESEMVGRARWLRVAGAFMLDPKLTKDFRLLRLQRMVVHLVDLIGLLAPRRLRDMHQQAREQYRDRTLDAVLDQRAA